MTFCENSDVFTFGSVAVTEMGGWPAALLSLSKMSNGASPAALVSPSQQALLAPCGRICAHGESDA